MSTVKSPSAARSHDLSDWTHAHSFDQGNAAGERGANVVFWITVVTMVVEIAAGWWFNSMALQADGWHMSSHAVAIGLSAYAYASARKYARDHRFAFGTWKMEVLAGFASAIFLICVAGLMVFGSVERLVAPQPIHYVEAMVIAGLGLLVNLVCATILGNAHHHGGDGHHGHGHDHGHGSHAGHDHGHAAHASHDHAGHDHAAVPAAKDLNLQSAYVHVLADAATSALAIAALAGGYWFGWGWLDPAVGIFGAVVVALWARGLIRDTSKVLLDREMDAPLVQRIREAVEQPNDPMQTRLTDLHVWRVGKGAYACALSVVTHDAALTPSLLRERLASHGEIAHSTIEVERCC